MNPRQKELKEKMRAMFKMARDWALTKAKVEGCAPKDVLLGKEEFLAHFEVYFFASSYASKRYFDGFVAVCIFCECKSKYGHDCFTVNWTHSYAGEPFPSEEDWDKPIEKLDAQ